MLKVLLNNAAPTVAVNNMNMGCGGKLGFSVVNSSDAPATSATVGHWLSRADGWHEYQITHTKASVTSFVI